jgi:hypothetical protein
MTMTVTMINIGNPILPALLQSLGKYRRSDQTVDREITGSKGYYFCDVDVEALERR